jgi:hypothetical protein
LQQPVRRRQVQGRRTQATQVAHARFDERGSVPIGKSYLISMLPPSSAHLPRTDIAALCIKFHWVIRVAVPRPILAINVRFAPFAANITRHRNGSRRGQTQTRRSERSILVSLSIAGEPNSRSVPTTFPTYSQAFCVAGGYLFTRPRTTRCVARGEASHLGVRGRNCESLYS